MRNVFLLSLLFSTSSLFAQLISERQFMMLLSDVSQAKTDSELIEIEQEFKENHEGEREQLEQLRYEIARRMKSLQGEAGSQWLANLSSDRPQILQEEVLCRQPVLKPRHPYLQAAEEALAIRKKNQWLNTFRTDWRWEWLGESKVQKHGAPYFFALLAYAEELSEQELQTAVEFLEKTEPSKNVFEHQILAHYCTKLGVSPSESNLAQISEPAALFLLHNLESFPTSEAEKILQLLERRPELASAARLASQEFSLQSPEQALRTPPDDIDLIAKATNPSLSFEERKNAVLALMLVRTTGHRDALRARLSDLPERLQADVRGWLGE